ncbi:hypothetical protein ACFE04_028102 [Oxalis oulophora]
MIFGAFGSLYCMSFVFSCGQVAYLVINKGLQIRTYVLALAVLVTLPLQIIFLGMSVMWSPGSLPHEAIVLVVFLCTVIRVIVGEGIIVIKPIVDSLSAGGGGCCTWIPSMRLVIEEQEALVVDV